MISLRRISAMLFLCLTLVVGGCNDEEETSSSQYGSGLGAVADLSSGVSAPRMAMMKSKGATQAFASDTIVDRTKLNGRKIEETHSFEIELKANEIQQRIKNDYQACLSLGCEVLASTLRSASNGYLNARIAPEKLADFFKVIENGVGEVKEHRVSVDDETSNYVDTAARLKNKTALRDRLMSLLESEKTKTVSDIMSIESELSRVQSEIDSITGLMNALEKRTSMATVNVQYEVPYYEREDRYRSISTSFVRAWRGFVQNLDEVIVFVGRALPWLPVVFLAVWIAAKTLRSGFSAGGRLLRRKKEEASKSATDAVNDKQN